MKDKTDNGPVVRRLLPWKNEADNMGNMTRVFWVILQSQAARLREANGYKPLGSVLPRDGVARLEVSQDKDPRGRGWIWPALGGVVGALVVLGGVAVSSWLMKGVTL